MRVWRGLALVVAAALLGIIVAGRRIGRYRAPAEPALGMAFPHLTLAPLPGMPPLDNGTLRAGRPTIVALFASWCGPCHADAALLADLRARGVPVAGIAVRDSADAASALARQSHFAAAGLDHRGAVQAALGSEGLPEAWVVDGAGIVRAHVRGALVAADVPRLTAAVAAAR